MLSVCMHAYASVWVNLVQPSDLEKQGKTRQMSIGLEWCPTAAAAAAAQPAASRKQGPRRKGMRAILSGWQHVPANRYEYILTQDESRAAAAAPASRP